MKIIAVHIGATRGGGRLSDDFITLVVARGLYRGHQRRNGDGMFTKEARKSGIPLFLLKSSREINALLREIFLQG
jgi:hypothetical protein